ncbi:MAG TPA: hypothetical protein VNV65_10685 [Candidatus Solibacter sp.]|jgi:hypothetical protein|nr:hypothetical protein [Candidatus Solibacter sp.]
MAKLFTEWDIHQLKAVPVISCDGLLLGRLDGIVHHPDGRRSALVVRRRWFHNQQAWMVHLEGAQFRDGAIHLDQLAAYLPYQESPRRTTVAP